MKKKVSLTALTIKSFHTSAAKGGLLQKDPMPAYSEPLLAANTSVANCTIT